MSEETKYFCNVCQKEIEEGHQQYYMAKITINHIISVDDGSCSGTEKVFDVYHVHNDFTNRCISKIWDLFKDRK